MQHIADLSYNSKVVTLCAFRHCLVAGIVRNYLNLIVCKLEPLYKT